MNILQAIIDFLSFNEPYKGSSKEFIELSESIDNQLSENVVILDYKELSLMLADISILCTLTKTVGDKEIIEKLMAKYRKQKLKRDIYRR